MYTLFSIGNVKKFVKDNADSISDQGRQILERAERISDNGIFPDSMVEPIMDDLYLSWKFRDDVMSSTEHESIRFQAILQQTVI
ncbi:hypothetical protein HGA64_03365 [Candidatus Falkowbacteria bacterium]|nr:hypothetical protein [Candidatus Falkowbacteria bacterium]